MKRFFSLFLAFVLVITALPMGAFAESDVEEATLAEEAISLIPGQNFMTKANVASHFTDSWMQNYWNSFSSWKTEGFEIQVGNDDDEHGNYMRFSWTSSESDGFVHNDYWPNGASGYSIETDRPIFVGFNARSSNDTYFRLGADSGSNVKYDGDKHTLYLSSSDWKYYSTSYTVREDDTVLKKCNLRFGAIDGTASQTVDIDDVVMSPYYRINYYSNGSLYDYAYVAPYSSTDGTRVTSASVNNVDDPTKDGSDFKGWSLSESSDSTVSTVDLANADINLYAVFTESTSSGTDPDPTPDPDPDPETPSTTTPKLGDPGISFFTKTQEFVDFDDGDWYNSWWTGSQFSAYLVEGENRTIENDGDERGNYLHVTWDKANNGILYGHYYPNSTDGIQIESDRPMYAGFYARSSNNAYVKFGNKAGDNYDGGDINYNYNAHCKYIAKNWTYYHMNFTRLPSSDSFVQFRVSYGATDQNVAQSVDIDNIVVAPYYKFTYLVDNKEYKHTYASPISDSDGTFLKTADANQLGSETPFKSGFKFVGWSLDGTNVVSTVKLENKDITLKAVFEESAGNLEPDAPTAPSDAKVGDPGINLFTKTVYKYGVDNGTVGAEDSTTHFNAYGGASNAVVALDGTNKVLYANIPSGGVSSYVRTSSYGFDKNRPITFSFKAKSYGTSAATVEVLKEADNSKLIDSQNTSSEWMTYTGKLSALEENIIIHAKGASLYMDDFYYAADYKFNYYVGGSLYESKYISPLKDDGSLAVKVDAKQVTSPTKPGYTFKGWALSDGGDVVDSVMLACADVNFYAVWDFSGALPGKNVLTGKNSAYDFSGGEKGNIDFSGAEQTVSDGVLKAVGTGAWYVYIARSQYNLTGYGRPITISFKVKAENSSSGDFVQLIGEDVWSGKQSYYPTSSWQTVKYDADTSLAQGKNDPAFIIYASSENGSTEFLFDDFVIAPNYAFTYYVDGTEYKTEYVSALDDEGNYRTSFVPTLEAPKKDGKKFLGWATSKNAEKALESVALANEDVVLYAVYEIDDEYYLGDGIVTAFDSKIEGAFGTLIFKQDFDNAKSIKDYMYDADYVSDYKESGATLSDTSFVKIGDGDASDPLFTIVKDPVSGVGKSLSMTGRSQYPILRLTFGGSVISKPGMYHFNIKSNSSSGTLDEKVRFYMNEVTNAESKTLSPSSSYWTEFPTHYGKWFTENDDEIYKQAQKNFFPNNSFRVVTKEEFENSSLKNTDYTLDYVYALRYIDIFLNNGNGKTVNFDDIELWFEEYADVTFVTDGSGAELDVSHRSFKPGTRLPELNVGENYKFLGWTENEGSDDYTMYARAGKYTLYPVVKTLESLDLSGTKLGKDVIAQITNESEFEKINTVEYLPNVLESDSFYEKALTLASAGIIDKDFSPYEYMTSTEMQNIANRVNDSSLRLKYTLKKSDDLMLYDAKTNITASYITAPDSYISTLETLPKSTLDMGMWLWGNYNTREYLRYNFKASKEIKKAELEIQADNSFDVYVNGAYYPSHKDGSWYVTNVLDITESTLVGANKLGVRFFHTNTPAKFSSAMRAAIKITYSDGSSDTFKSDASNDWKFYVICGHYEANEHENWATVDSIGSLDNVVHLPLMSSQYHPRALRRSMYFRKDFESTKTVKKATLFSGSKGLYIPYINGERVDDAKFISGAMVKVAEYQAFDVTDFINNGSNTLSAMTGNGWYNSENISNMYWNKPQLLMQLEIEYEDGSKTVIGTDNTWSVTASPLYDNDIQFGERYDARLEIEGWNEVGTDVSDWKKAEKVTNTLEMRLQDYPATKAHEQRAKSISTLNDTSFCYDFGTNSAGRAKLVLRNTKEGEIVIVRYAEDISDGDACTEVYGDVYFTYDSLASGRAAYSARNIDVYICKGADVEVFEPEFTYTGFRYIYVTGYTGDYTLDTVRKMDMYTDNEEIGDITTSDEDITRLWDAVKRSYRSNIIGGPQDCPTREKNFWNGDIQVYVNTANWYMNNNAFLARWTETGRKMQLNVYGWEDEEYIVPLSLYHFFGNTDVLEAKYPTLVEIIEKREGHVASDGLPTGTEPYGYSPYNDHMATIKVSSDFYAAAFFCRMYRDAAEIATVLGKTDDAAKYSKKFEDARAKFNEKYYESDKHDYNQHCQGGVVIPMAFGICDESERVALAQTLHNYVVSANYQQNSGFTSAEYLYGILCEYGYEQDAIKILKNETYPSLLYMLSTGATTMTERWDGIQPHTFASANHYAFGSFAKFFFENIAGIKSTKPNFDEISVIPTFVKELGDFKATYKSAHGLICSEWKYDKNSDCFTWTVTVPEGVNATLKTPNGTTMTLSGKTETYTVSSNGALANNGIKINIGAKAKDTNVRFVEVDGVQTALAENEQNVYVASLTKNSIIEIVEKESASDVNVVKAQYFYVDVANKTYKKLDLDTFTQTYKETSVRVNDPIGLRFKAKISASAKNETQVYEITEYGYIISRKSVLSDSELNFDFAKYVSASAYNKATGKDIVYDSSNDEYTVFTGVLYNIPEKYYKEQIVCKTYTKIKIDGTEYTVYGEPATGTIYETAKASYPTATGDVKNALNDIISKADKSALIEVDGLFKNN